MTSTVVELQQFRYAKVALCECRRWVVTTTGLSIETLLPERLLVIPTKLETR